MFTVLDPGALTTVQDAGRIGWARYGVPPSGPMDAAAFAAANALVGNAPDAAALELTLTGPTLHVWHEALIAVCGAPFELWAGRLSLPMWHAVYLRAGTRLRFGQRLGGARAVLAVAGGIIVPPYLGSRATHLMGGFGGYGGRALRAGDRLSTGPAARRNYLDEAGRVWPLDQRPAYTPAPVVRVVLGPQDDHVAPEAIATFLSAAYTVTPASDRMGIRTQGLPLAHRGETGIVSDGVVTGSVQVPPDGRPIVMMVDHQTTGGYPKIATVIRADLPLLAQLLPGDTIRFTSVTPAEARRVDTVGL
ncbi:MAG: biotin-dependent carboxyltransferase [Anaerolineae bacterium]|nr:biotin-dependent carboxyltransferase [Anaerolineae bacterium]